MAQRILVVDDEPIICRGFEGLAKSEGLDAETTSSAEEALSLADERSYDAVVLDVRLPGIDGLEALPMLKEKLPNTPIIVMTAHGDLSTAVRAVELGAFDYLPKPFELEDARRLLQRALAQVPLNSRERQAPVPPGNLVGSCPAMQSVFRQIALAAQHDSPVLVTGESGTGKELVARAIHANSLRTGEAFIPVHLASLNPALLERELFGHAAGAYTGAASAQQGLIEQANHGTLFLDEIGEAGPDIQVKLLRTIESGEFYRVGDSQRRTSDFRLITATNRPLDWMLDESHFRPDLYYRIATIHIHLPALRDRRDDIPLLAKHFLATAGSVGTRRLSDAAVAELRQRTYRGNIRELRNTVLQAAMKPGQIIDVDDLPPAVAGTCDTTATEDSTESLTRAAKAWAAENISEGGSGRMLDAVQLVESEVIAEVLRMCGGNKAEAARRLGIHRETLREKLRSNPPEAPAS
ncbi:MAG: sigma-54-dependent Fis family transcriptional regulator [Planctomycetaceae bacterium]|nr:sigma-54-dependent Fis family transcriptional regulator [Planctomycetaceae bacterium]